MSTSATPGRTWFDPEDGTLPQPGTCYLGLHVPLEHMRRNACTFSDFHTDHQDRARRKLLRMFLRINFCLMADGISSFPMWAMVYAPPPSSSRG